MKRVLFVDDEPLVLGALKRMLWPMRAEFATAYANNGPEALSAFEETPFDVIVSDMRMPGMDGADLLMNISQKWPNAVRIVLTGECSPDALTRVLPVAHRFLSKPCDAELLRNTIQRACALRSLLGSSEIRALTTGMTSLPTLPENYRQVVDELQSAEPSMPRVAGLISRDVAMTARLIQVTNSPLFGRRWPATSVTQAVIALGSEMTKTLVLASSLFSRLSPKAAAAFRLGELWDHSRRVADLAKRVADSWDVPARVGQDAATAGFLHEAGRLVLAARMPERYMQVIRRAESDGLTVEQAEMDSFGVTHAEIGAYLLELWGLPDSVVEAVAWQHDPAGCPGLGPSAVAAVHVADAVMEALDENRAPDVAPAAAHLAAPEMLDEWRRQANEVAVEAAV